MLLLQQTIRYLIVTIFLFVGISFAFHLCVCVCARVLVCLYRFVFSLHTSWYVFGALSVYVHFETSNA